VDAARHVGALTGQRVTFVHAQQDGAHAFQVLLAHLGECDAARGAVEQPRAQVRLELGHHARDHWRRHVQRARGLGETAFVGDLGKHLHGAKLVHLSS
jgi:hypothetical protein